MKSSNYNLNQIKQDEKGALYNVSIKIPIKEGMIENVYFQVSKTYEKTSFKLDFKKIEDGFAVFENDIYLETRAIYHYYFSCTVNGREYKFKREDITNKEDISQNEMWKMSVNFETSEWAKGKIMYHIFVDRFFRGSQSKMEEMPRRIRHESFSEDVIIGPDKNGIWNNDFYGGDLLGIEEKLDYIKSLGTTIIYLSPIVHSQSNHRYDAADFENVDPYAGTNENLKSLCQKAHEKGMKIVLDAVFNHTGNDSKYFNEYNTFDNVGAFQDRNSEYAPFYRKYYDNGHVKYEYWWGMTNLPVCDGYSTKWREYILGKGGIIDQWFDLGIDGLRLDVADELTDDFIEGIRIATKRNKKDGFILGEVWKNPMRMNRGYIESGKAMDSVMNYSLIDALIRYFKYGDVDKLAYIIKDIKNEYPEDTINTLMNFTSTHDISRAINIFSCDEFNKQGEWAWDPIKNNLDYCKDFKLTKEQYENGKDIYQAYVFALTFFPGILSIFYGDEVGIEGLGNLANRKPFPWGKEDNELLSYFKEIGQIRGNEKFLEEAELKLIDINYNYLMFERKSNNEKLLIVINRTGEIKTFNIPEEYEKSNEAYTLKKSNKKTLTPYGAVTFKKDNIRI